MSDQNNHTSTEPQISKNFANRYINISREELIEETLKRNQGILADNGALCIKTGDFTGRSPKDRFIVLDNSTKNDVNWGNFNTAFDKVNFDLLEADMLKYMQDNEIFIRDNYVCADEQYKLKVRTYCEFPWSSLFADNMFLRPSSKERKDFEPEWNILCIPSFKANPQRHQTNRQNFSIINFEDKKVLIGGSGYTGEIKKGVFTVLNFILPIEKGVFPMHCSANTGKDGDVAIYFGLSGTGKTTLSADPNRFLIGDDEHGWNDEGVFNFEGGCYAKTVNLSQSSEPDIYNAIKFGALLENIGFENESRKPNYTDIAITENTRVSYPIHHISNALPVSKGGHPQNIFFLTCDSFGVLPPISKLTPGQAMYHFITGYTAKVAGTEDGVKEPTGTFSACFGAPFLLLHPAKYAAMLGEKLKKHKTNVWLINTGWSCGPYGIGQRMKLSYTRSMIKAGMNGQLNQVAFQELNQFGLSVPVSCPEVPENILNPRNTWSDKVAFDAKEKFLVEKFAENFKKYYTESTEEIRNGGPTLNPNI